MSKFFNSEILIWARKRNRLSVEELAKKMHKDPGEILQWENGTKTPSYTSLEELAYRHLKIPLAVFFFPDPPKIEDPLNNFRRLPDYEFSRLSSDTLQKIRLAQSYQESLKEIAATTRFKIRSLLSWNINESTIQELAKKTRGYLGITINKQLTFQSYEEAFKSWRRALEEVGIFTFKDSLKDRYISGFCLLDDEFPIIFINNSNSHSRQIFSLIHEFGHILFQVYGILDIDRTYIKLMTSQDQRIEIKCNKFAAEVLVPDQSFEHDILNIDSLTNAIITDLADKYTVSREVILRRCLDHQLITRDYYEKQSSEWNKDYLRSTTKRTGGNFYLTRLAYLGQGFTTLAFKNFYQGGVNRAELAQLLNMKARHLDKLESHLNW